MENSTLLHELVAVEKIILAMLAVMSPKQKLALGMQLDAAGVSGQGIIRYHERRAVLVAAGAA